jgi:hypothetical protein
MMSNASSSLMKSVAQGAATTVWAATSPQLSGMGGVYLADCEIAPIVTDIAANPAGVLEYAIDPEIALDLWDLSEQMMKVRPKKS